MVVPDADYKAALLGRGLPEPVAAMFMGMFAASRAREFESVAPELATLLGRPPEALRAFLKGVVSAS